MSLLREKNQLTERIERNGILCLQEKVTQSELKLEQEKLKTQQERGKVKIEQIKLQRVEVGIQREQTGLASDRVKLAIAIVGVQVEEQKLLQAQDSLSFERANTMLNRQEKAHQLQLKSISVASLAEQVRHQTVMVGSPTASASAALPVR